VQEYVDCTYDYQDGCSGGRFDRAYEYSSNNGGRIGAENDYPYKAKYKPGECKRKSISNAAVAYKIVGYKKVPAGEDSNIAALTEGALAMGLKVTQKFYPFRKGIFKDTTCIKGIKGYTPNHAVTGVGYTESYFVIKNSWSTDWGMNGFMRLARNYHNCGLWGYSVIPKLEATGKKDNGKDDKKARYDGEADDDGNDEEDQDDDSSEEDEKNDSNGNCKDKSKGCLSDMCEYKKFAADWCQKTCGHCRECEDNHNHCENSFCKYTSFSKKYCQSTCNMCDKRDNDGCGPGLTKCPDGLCRHEHMC
jgi:hypothetical protein